MGDKQNVNGLGAFAAVYYNHGRQQVYENNPYRGYLSTVQNMAHFGLGNTQILDSVVIKWGNGKQQTLCNIKANQVLTVNVANAREAYCCRQPVLATNSLFKEVTSAKGIHFKHNEPDVIDFDIQALLPHKLSEYCPALAAGDIDGNGLDDLIIGGNSAAHAQLFLQQENGRFLQKELPPGISYPDMENSYKDEGILIFDANGDGKPDVYIASGGYKKEAGSNAYQDRLYINAGKGNFIVDSLALPVNFTSKLCVRALDYNKDGKPDLFVSGRVDPWNYPKPVSSFIFRNDTKNGHIKFTDVTSEVAPDLINIGLVCDALFTDFDNDDQPDLILAGEWMPVTFLKNNKGVFKKYAATSINDQTGFWNTITAGDFRHTGRMDYIVGNAGLNTIYQASAKYPVCITAKDFDEDGHYDAIPSYYLPDKNGEKKEFPMYGRDDMLKQMNSLRKKYSNYQSFAVATMDDIFSPEQKKGALKLKANTLQSCYLRNEGNGKFTMIPLPKQAQLSVLNGLVVDDFDGDGNLDVAISGNDYGTEVSAGRYDALNGLVLKGDGKGNFKPLSILESGVYIPGNGKALVKLQSSNNSYLLAASQNGDALKLFELKRSVTSIRLLPADVSAVIQYKNGAIQKQEFYYGSSFLSQSARFFSVDKTMASVKIKNSIGQSRSISLN